MSEYDVYLSYAPDDAEWVCWFAQRLVDAGLTVAFDKVLLRPGDVVVHTIEDAIRQTAWGLLVFSRAALSSAWVCEEYAALMRRAIEGWQGFVPIVIADVELPEFAANRFHVDLSGIDGPEYDQRVEKLVQIIRGEAPPLLPSPVVRPGTGVRPEGPLRYVLRVTPEATVLQDEGDSCEPVTHRPRGANPRLDGLCHRLDNVHRRGEYITRSEQSGRGVGSVLAEIGEALRWAYLDGAAGDALITELARAEHLNVPLRLGLEVADELAYLPWETLIPAPGAEPLSLHPRVQLYRRVATGSLTSSISIPGPLRILVAVASPEDPGGGPVLDFENELARILDAVDSARHPADSRRRAYVRILNQGTLEAIRDALLQERYHVLHISCHAELDVLLLEDDQGRTDRVTTERFVREALPAGRGVPLVVLSGCSTARLAQPGKVTVLGSPALALSRAGAPAVLAMTAAVTDRYATALADMLYRELTIRDVPEALPAFCDARRRLEDARRRLSDDHPEAGLVEWATPALFMRGPSLRLYDPDAPFDEITSPAEHQFADGVPLRRVGEFVGRRAELRTLLSIMRGTTPGVVVHGIGGIGKSTLAAELLRRLGTDAGVVVSAVGEISTDRLLDEVAATLLHHFDDETVRKVALTVRDPKNSWEQRLRTLSRLLAHVPMTLLLDNFEDNLRLEGTEPTVGDQELAELLTALVRTPGQHRLLITTRYAFGLPHRAHRRLTSVHLGPLSLAETRKLMWRLPALDALLAIDQERAWMDVGGHPRALEYLDAVLREGEAQFADVRERLEDLLESRSITASEAWFRTAGPTLDAALAESITLAADDTLLRELVGLLTETELDLLAGASVYRRPVDRIGLAWAVASPARTTQDTGLDDRIERLNTLIAKARQRDPDADLEDLGLPEDELAQAKSDVCEFFTPPVTEPLGIEQAQATLTRLGLLSQVSFPSGAASAEAFMVHRWTAGTLAEIIGPERIAAAHRAAAEHWRWVFRMAAGDGQAEVAILLEARHHFRRVGDITAAAGATHLICQHLDQWGAWSWEQRLLEETLSWFPQGSRGRAQMLGSLGDVAFYRGDLTTAMAKYEHALNIAKALNDQGMVAATLNQLAVVAVEAGAVDTARRHFQEAVRIYELLSNPIALPPSYRALGDLALRVEGDLDQAQRWFERALDLNLELGKGKHADAGELYHQLAVVAVRREELSVARELLGKALGIAKESDHQLNLSNSYHELAKIAHLENDLKEAVTLLHRSLAAKERIGDRIGMAVGYASLGILAAEQEDWKHALDWYRQSLAIDNELGRWAQMAYTLNLMAHSFAGLGRLPDALANITISLMIRFRMKQPGARCDSAWLAELWECLHDEGLRALLTRSLDPKDADVFFWALDAAPGEGEANPAG
ncbi:tetratricopeptide repeat protein [Actinomadura sp. 6N118]|uniref:tetratricopeptide repeat protein n=1 Tax=Actinomadura sp. 6N118 TaxID=3375151 RepID=UPI0037AD02B6